jgi:type IV pilus assembly protein PilQ
MKKIMGILLSAVLTVSLAVNEQAALAQAPNGGDGGGNADASGVFPSLVHQGDITDFLKMLSVASQKNIVPSRNVRGAVSVNLFDVTFREALDAVVKANGYGYEEKGSFIFVYTDKELAQLQSSAKRMESKAFHLNYIPASDVHNLIAPFLSESAEVTTSPDAGTGDFESGEKWSAGNYVIVFDYPENIEKIGELIVQIDTRPPQVLIEATILVANVSDENQLGIDFNILGGLDLLSAEIGDFTVTEESLPIDGTATIVQSGTQGLKVGIFKNNMEILIEALETVTDVVTLGNPKILTLNRQMGKVLVGNSDGYITTEVSQTTATQTVQFLDTGTELTFRPFVMDDGYIRMELFTKDSDGGVEVKDGFTLPSESTAEVNSNVLVQDGHTIVIGGLFRERTSFTRSQVPFMGNLPLIGPVFRETTDDSSKEEVIFMITPHIVNETIEDAMAQDAMESIDTLRLGVREGLLFYGRDSLATAYYQMARQNQADGKLNSALWNAQLATSCNPLFLDAVALREDLMARRLYKEQYGSMQFYMRNLLEKQAGLSQSTWVPLQNSEVQVIESPESAAAGHAVATETEVAWDNPIVSNASSSSSDESGDVKSASSPTEYDELVDWASDDQGAAESDASTQESTDSVVTTDGEEKPQESTDDSDDNSDTDSENK